jgi:hypothetical protein
MLTKEQKSLAATALRDEATERRRQADSLQRFVVDETPVAVKDTITAYRREADDLEQVADALDEA